MHVSIKRCMHSLHVTYIQRRPQNLCHFYPGVGLKLGSLGFSCNQNNCGSSGAYVTCIYCSLIIKINTHINIAQHTHIVDAFVLRVWSAKTKKNPIWVPRLMKPLLGAGQYARSGISLVYLCCMLDNHIDATAKLR